MGGQGRGVAMTMWKKMWSTPGKEREFLGWPAIVFILTQLVFGLPLLPYALYRWHSVDPLRFASFLAVALAASLFKVRLPGIHATMSANFLFILVGILDLSYPETLLMGCLGGLVQSLWYATPRPRRGIPQGLNQPPQTTHQQSFRIGQIEDAHQDEQKVGRHRGVDARQANLEERGGQRYGQERCEAQRINGVPAVERVRQQRQAKNQLREDEHDCRPPEELPLFSGGAPHLLPHRHCNSTPLNPYRSFRLALAKIKRLVSAALIVRSGNASAS